MQEIAVEFVYFNNRKWRTCNLENDNGKLLMEMVIVTFLDANVTADVLSHSKQ